MLITIIILVLSAIFFVNGKIRFGYCGALCVGGLTHFSDINPR